MKPLAIKSPAKLNLYLRVIKKRSDGFHEIQTLFERINLFDEINLRLNHTGKINIQCSHPDVPCDRGNLVFRAAEILKEDFSRLSGVDIRIKKQIPVGSGLGGGSSNAASTLIGLNKLWRLGLDKDKLLQYAQKIGSDVPFFILQSSFALGGGRGDELRPLRGVKKTFWHILVVPDIKISTEKIYKQWDRNQFCLKRGNNSPSIKFIDEIKKLVTALRDADPRTIGKKFFNDLEYITSKATKVISKIKIDIKRAGAQAISMSGSGPAVFGLLISRKEADAVKKRLAIQNGWQAFVVKTY